MSCDLLEVATKWGLASEARQPFSRQSHPCLASHALGSAGRLISVAESSDPLLSCPFLFPRGSHRPAVGERITTPTPAILETLLRSAEFRKGRFLPGAQSSGKAVSTRRTRASLNLWVRRGLSPNRSSQRLRCSCRWLRSSVRATGPPSMPASLEFRRPSRNQPRFPVR